MSPDSDSDDGGWRYDLDQVPTRRYNYSSLFSVRYCIYWVLKVDEHGTSSFSIPIPSIIKFENLMGVHPASRNRERLQLSLTGRVPFTTDSIYQQSSHRRWSEPKWKELARYGCSRRRSWRRMRPPHTPLPDDRSSPIRLLVSLS
jgi:hypothetical protein